MTKDHSIKQGDVESIRGKLKAKGLEAGKEVAPKTPLQRGDIKVGKALEKESVQVEAQPVNVSEAVPTNAQHMVLPINSDIPSFEDWNTDKEVIKPSNVRGNSGKGSLSVVHNENSKRVKLSDDVLSPLGFPKAVRIVADASNKIISMFCDEDSNNAHVLKGKTKANTIYSAALVQYITDLFGLDFAERTSITFGMTDVTIIEGKTIVNISWGTDTNASEANV